MWSIFFALSPRHVHFLQLRPTVTSLHVESRSYTFYCTITGNNDKYFHSVTHTHTRLSEWQCNPLCKSAPHSRQITTPAPHCSVFYGPDALPAAQGASGFAAYFHSVKEIKVYSTTLRSKCSTAWHSANLYQFQWRNCANPVHSGPK